jgi:ribose transport system permease protein
MTGLPRTAEQTQSAREDSLRIRLIPFIDRYGIILVVVAMGLVLTILEPEFFLTWRNLTNVTRQISVNAMLALGQFLVILTAGIDLSVGSVMALAMVTLAQANAAGWPWYIVILVGPLVGLAFGLINGLGLTKLRLPHPFIVTLGTLNIARGLTNIVSGGVPVSGLYDEVRFLGFVSIPIGSWFGESRTLPVSIILIGIFYFIFWIFLQHIRKGRHIYALGGNPQSARVTGINVDRTLILVYALCGTLAGTAGLLLAGRTNSGFPNAGIGAELDAIAAVIIGGASFFGGRGMVWGVLAGALIMGLLRNGLNLLDVSVFWQQILIGAVIILAVYIDVLRRQAGSDQG